MYYNREKSHSKHEENLREIQNTVRVVQVLLWKGTGRTVGQRLFIYCDKVMPKPLQTASKVVRLGSVFLLKIFAMVD